MKYEDLIVDSGIWRNFVGWNSAHVDWTIVPDLQVPWVQVKKEKTGIEELKNWLCI